MAEDIAPVSLTLLRAVFNNMKGRVRYDLGAKAVDLAADSHTIREIDCSGFVRFALYRATDGKLVIPDGSWYQRQWCDTQRLHRLAHYADVQYAIGDPSRLFIAFIPSLHGHPGHVWLVCDGHTMESHGGVGVDARPWNEYVLLRNANAAYELPTAD